MPADITHILYKAERLATIFKPEASRPPSRKTSFTGKDWVRHHESALCCSVELMIEGAIFCMFVPSQWAHCQQRTADASDLIHSCDASQA